MFKGIIQHHQVNQNRKNNWMNPKASKYNGCGSVSASSDLVIQSLTGSIANMTIASNDAAILGQLDRRDVLFLGPENLTSNATRKKFRNVLLESFHPKLTPEFIFQELLWTLSEKVLPEMVLEGYLPKE